MASKGQSQVCCYPSYNPRTAPQPTAIWLQTSTVPRQRHLDLGLWFLILRSIENPKEAADSSQGELTRKQHCGPNGQGFAPDARVLRRQAVKSCPLQRRTAAAGSAHVLHKLSPRN